jgi:hypothetical protein
MLLGLAASFSSLRYKIGTSAPPLCEGKGDSPAMPLSPPLKRLIYSEARRPSVIDIFEIGRGVISLSSPGIWF